jgi:hypothetical protein
MKVIFTFIGLLLLTTTSLALADDQVYTNGDLRPEPQMYSRDRGQQLPKKIIAPQQNNQNNMIGRQDPISTGANTETASVQQPLKQFQQPLYPPPANQDALAKACAVVSSFFIIVVGIPLIFWILTLIDILRNEFTGSNKIVWLLVATFFPLIGPILYFFIGTDQKIQHEDPDEK